MEEKWKDIQGYNGDYQVSNFGRVKSFKDKNPIILKPHRHKVYGHRSVSLCKEGKRKEPQIYRLVAEAFIPNPDNKPVVNHLDGDRSNDCVSNLEWCTQSENIQHAHDNGFTNPAKGVRHGNSKMTKAQVIEVRRRYETGESSIEIAKDYPIGPRTVIQIINKETWNHI